MNKYTAATIAKAATNIAAISLGTHLGISEECFVAIRAILHLFLGYA
jgi:hypothetical protein